MKYKFVSKANTLAFLKQKKLKAMLRGAVSEFLYHQYDYFRKTKYTIIISFSYIFFLLSFFLFGHKNS